MSEKEQRPEGERLEETLQNAFVMYKDRPFLGDIIYENGKPVHVEYGTYWDVWKKLCKLFYGLKEFVTPHCHVGIFGQTCEEWIMSDILTVLCGAVSVPIQPTLPPAVLSHIINETKLSSVMFSGDLNNFISLLAVVPDSSITHIVVCTLSPNDITHLEIPNHIEILWINDLLSIELQNTKIPSTSIVPSDSLTIMYTSGTSGMPKGAALPDSHWNTFIRNYWSYDPLVGHSFMPLTHGTGRLFIYTCIFNGGCIALHTNPDIGTIFDEFLIVNPTIVVSAPRLYNMIYREYEEDIKNCKDSEEIRKLEEMKYKKIFGSRVRAVCFGGAATAQIVLDFFTRILDCIVADGYGASEVGGIAINNNILPNVIVKLISVPELDYFTTDEPFSRGEICVKTPTMFRGYLNSEESPFDEEGFYHTGDIGQLEGKGILRLIDRRKNVFKLSQGEFVAAQRIESIYVSIPIIQQICVYGNTLMDSILAIVVVDSIEIHKRAAVSGVSTESLLYSVSLQQEILDLITEIAEKEKLESFNIPSGLILTLEPFTEENDMLTASMKMKRNSIISHYKPQLDKLYNQVSNIELGEAPDISDIESVTLDLQNIFKNLIKMPKETSFPIEKPLRFLGGDSLSFVAFSRTIEKRYGSTISLIQFIQQDLSLSDLLNIVTGNHVEDKSNIIDIYKEIERITSEEDILWQNIEPALATSSENWKNVLVTGATGFLGSFMVYYLISNTSFDVYCLVRGDSLDSAKKRIDNILLKIDPNFQLNRVHVILGDIFQLKSEMVNNIQYQIDCVIHSAADTNSISSYKQLYNSNIIGTLNVLNFLRNQPKHLRNMVYVSTAGFMMNSGGEINENHNIDTDLIQHTSGYCQTKYVADNIVQNHIQQGNIKGVCIRPTMIGGCSKTGICSTGDWVVRFLKGCLEIKKYPKLPKGIHLLDWVPVDFCCDIIIQVLKEWESLNQSIIHLHNNHSLTDFCSLGKVIERKNVEIVDYSVWLGNIENSPDLIRIRAMFSDNEFPLRKSTIIQSNYLSKTSPEIDENIISLYLNYLSK